MQINHIRCMVVNVCFAFSSSYVLAQPHHDSITTKHWRHHHQAHYIHNNLGGTLNRTVGRLVAGVLYTPIQAIELVGTLTVKIIDPHRHMQSTHRLQHGKHYHHGRKVYYYETTHSDPRVRHPFPITDLNIRPENYTGQDIAALGEQNSFLNSIFPLSLLCPHFILKHHCCDHGVIQHHHGVKSGHHAKAQVSRSSKHPKMHYPQIHPKTTVQKTSSTQPVASNMPAQEFNATNQNTVNTQAIKSNSPTETVIKEPYESTPKPNNAPNYPNDSLKNTNQVTLPKVPNQKTQAPNDNLETTNQVTLPKVPNDTSSTNATTMPDQGLQPTHPVILPTMLNQTEEPNNTIQTPFAPSSLVTPDSQQSLNAKDLLNTPRQKLYQTVRYLKNNNYSNNTAMDEKKNQNLIKKPANMAINKKLSAYKTLHLSSTQIQTAKSFHSFPKPDINAKDKLNARNRVLTHLRLKPQQPVMLSQNKPLTFKELNLSMTQVQTAKSFHSFPKPDINAKDKLNARNRVLSHLTLKPQQPVMLSQNKPLTLKELNLSMTQMQTAKSFHSFPKPDINSKDKQNARIKVLGQLSYSNQASQHIVEKDKPLTQAKVLHSHDEPKPAMSSNKITKAQPKSIESVLTSNQPKPELKASKSIQSTSKLQVAKDLTTMKVNEYTPSWINELTKGSILQLEQEIHYISLPSIVPENLKRSQAIQIQDNLQWRNGTSPAQQISSKSSIDQKNPMTKQESQLNKIEVKVHWR